MRSALAPVVAFLLLGLAVHKAAPAHAATPAKLDMSWQAPSECPAYSDVESWLQAVIPPDAGLVTVAPDDGFRAAAATRNVRA